MRFVIALASLSFVAACGGTPGSVKSSAGAEAASQPSGRTTDGAAANSETRGPAAPVPAAAGERTADGAGEFAKFYNEQVGLAFHTGDTSWLESHSGEGCRLCTQLIKETNERFSRNGIRADKNPISCTVLRNEKSEDGAYRAHLNVRVSGYTNIDADGATYPKVGSDSEFVFEMRWSNGGWQMEQGDLVSSN